MITARKNHILVATRNAPARCSSFARLASLSAKKLADPCPLGLPGAPRRGSSALKTIYFLSNLSLPVEGHKRLRSSPLSETDTSCSSKINNQSFYSLFVRYFSLCCYRIRGLSLLSNLINLCPSNVPETAREKLL